MADYTDSKSTVGAQWPPQGLSAEFATLEPVIGYEEITTRHLFGIPLVSQMKGPNNQVIKMTADQVKDIIEGAVQQAELDCRINIHQVQWDEKHPFDRNHYEVYGFFRLPHRPICSVDKIAVTPSNGVDVYQLPLEWMEMANAFRGQINIIPMTAAFIQGGYISSGSTGAAFFLSILGNRAWIPAYWKVTYTTGFPQGQVPRIINELIGTIAAQEILSMLAVTYARTQSHSLGLDGVSQSVSSPGPAVFQVRMEELQTKRDRLTRKIRNAFGTGLFSSHV